MTRHGEFATTAECKTIYRGDDRLGAHLEAAKYLLAGAGSSLRDERRLALKLADVGARNEGSTCASDDYAANIGSYSRLIDRRAELCDRSAVQRVEFVGPIDGDRRDPVGHLEGQEVIGRHARNISAAADEDLPGSVLAWLRGMRQKWLLRRGSGPGRYRYVTASGARVDGRRASEIDALAIPPGWTDVHVAAGPRSAIQAWGFDTRGRKQYRYHPNAVRRGERRKFYRVRQMGCDLPTIRQRVQKDFRRRGMPRVRLCAAIVKFLADGFFRIGNERYARENGTFGLTTLKKSHVRVDGDVIVFSYIGKRSIRHRQTVVSRELAAFVTSLLAVPGARLFRFQDEDGRWQNVESAHVNQYLREIANFPYSAKDLRTWGGTLRAATVLADIGPAASVREAKGNVNIAIRLVAAELGNTPAICRKSYVHPVVIERYVDTGDTIQIATAAGGKRAGQTPEERALVKFLDNFFPERRKRRRTSRE